MLIKTTRDGQVKGSRSQFLNGTYSVHSFIPQRVINYHVPDTIVNTGDSAANRAEKNLCPCGLTFHLVPILHRNFKKRICAYMYMCMYEK